jgi:phosphonate transport system substrate-binding protein
MKMTTWMRVAALSLCALWGMAAHAAEPYKIAVTDVDGMERLQTEWGPFKAAMESATGVTFAFFPVNSRTAAAEALKAKHVDFVVTGPAEYVVINKMTKARPLIGLGRPDYFCAIIVMADSGVNTIADLKGKKVGFSDVGSTSGHLCPMQLLKDYGIDPMKDIDRVHTKRNILHESLKRGDLAAIGYNHNSWLAQARDKDKSMPAGAFRILARSGDLPNDMLMVGAHVDPAIAEKVQKGMLANKAAVIKGIMAHEENATRYVGMDLRPVDDKTYAVVRDMYATIGYPQYSQFVGD